MPAYRGALEVSLQPDDSWLLLEHGLCPTAFNMAFDEALLEAMPLLSKPVLRFYGWLEPAASFGYFQRHAEIEPLTCLRPLVRRPTAGGLVPHQGDWTYSLAFPPAHEWYALPAKDSYRKVHQWLKAAFESLGISTRLAPGAWKEAPGQCFVGHEESDLLWLGQKIAGAAQRRRRDGLLIEGSVQPPPGPSRNRWQESMRETGRQLFGICWKEFVPDAALLERAQQLLDQKYGQPGFNRKR